jgi:hypothetical protein
MVVEWSLSAVRAEAADFGPGDRNFEVAIERDLFLQLFVELALEFANLAAANAGDMDVVAGAMAFVEMAMSAEMQQIEFVDQTELLEQFEGAINSDARDFWVDLLRAFENFSRIEVPRSTFDYLKQDTALARQTNATGTKFALKTAWWFVNVDAFAGRNAMCRCGCHGMVHRHYSKTEFEVPGNEALRVYQSRLVARLR